MPTKPGKQAQKLAETFPQIPFPLQRFGQNDRAEVNMIISKLSSNNNIIEHKAGDNIAVVVAC